MDNKVTEMTVDEPRQTHISLQQYTSCDRINIYKEDPSFEVEQNFTLSKKTIDFDKRIDQIL